jgi:hypothetical protein
MRSHIKIEDYDDVELFKAESNLREQGYRLVRKQSEKYLLPGEYIKPKFSRFLHSSGEQGRWTLRWRVK